MCKECPFKKTSLPGYLGNDTPDGFLATTMADTPMPCHMQVDYERDDWREQASKAALCAGALHMFANMCKLSRDSTRPRLPKSDEVFTFPSDFLKHHKGNNDDQED